MSQIRSKFIIISLMGLMACTGLPPTEKLISSTTSPSSSQPEGKLGTIPISTDRTSYHPAMSSTVGIGFTPLYVLGPSPEGLKFKWRCSYGYFVSWDSPQFEVKKRGQEVTTDLKKIYWSYDPAEVGKDKPVVQITLTVVDAQTSAILTTSMLVLEWENKDTVKVRL